MEQKPAEKRAVSLMPERFKLAAHERNVWAMTAEHGTTVDDIMKPEYWMHLAPQLRPYDRIEVRIDDGVFFLELLVIQSGQNWAKVFKLNEHQLVKASLAPVPDGQYGTKWNGPHNKFVVFRKSDNEIISKYHQTEPDAIAAMREYEAKL